MVFIIKNPDFMKDLDSKKHTISISVWDGKSYGGYPMSVPSQATYQISTGNLAGADAFIVGAKKRIRGVNDLIEMGLRESILEAGDDSIYINVSPGDFEANLSAAVSYVESDFSQYGGVSNLLEGRDKIIEAFRKLI